MSKILSIVLIANLAIMAIGIGGTAYYSARHAAWLEVMHADHAAFLAWEARIAR